MSRLFGRAAFGATQADLDEWAGRPYAEVVDHLLSVPDPAGRADDAVWVTMMEASMSNIAGFPPNWWVGPLYWLDWMRLTPYPFEERLVLAFHDHWAVKVGGATSHATVGQQLRTIRHHSLGSFRELAAAMNVDVALLQFLDGNTNRAEEPNENYAREFFELFTLGTYPQAYTEDDIREAARAFTGWRSRGAEGARYAEFDASRHDTGTKTVLGETIPDLGDQEHRRLVDIALAQPVAPKFLAYKLVQNFGYVPDTLDLFADPDPLVDTVADALVANDWDLRAAGRALLLSDDFRYGDPAAGQTLLRSPIEVAVHAAKILGTPFEGDLLGVIRHLRSCGQFPMEPPNVGGWLLGRAWLSESTIQNRYNLFNHLLKITYQWATVWEPAIIFPPSSDVESGDGSEWAAFLGLAELSSTTLQATRDYLANFTWNPNYFEDAAASPEVQKQHGIFLLVTMSPDWQVM